MKRRVPKTSHTAAIANSHTFYHVNVHMPLCSYALSRLITDSETSLQKFAVVPLNSADSFWRPFKTGCTGILISGQVRLRLATCTSFLFYVIEVPPPSVKLLLYMQLYTYWSDDTKVPPWTDVIQNNLCKSEQIETNNRITITASLQRSRPTLMH
jgi:hypothetical protein